MYDDKTNMNTAYLIAGILVVMVAYLIIGRNTASMVVDGFRPNVTIVGADATLQGLAWKRVTNGLDWKQDLVFVVLVKNNESFPIGAWRAEYEIRNRSGELKETWMEVDGWAGMSTPVIPPGEAISFWAGVVGRDDYQQVSLPWQDIQITIRVKPADEPTLCHVVRTKEFTLLQNGVVGNKRYHIEGVVNDEQFLHSGLYGPWAHVNYYDEAGEFTGMDFIWVDDDGHFSEEIQYKPYIEHGGAFHPFSVMGFVMDDVASAEMLFVEGSDYDGTYNCPNR